jgi:hypothetical protein
MEGSGNGDCRKQSSPGRGPMKKRCPWPGSDPLYLNYHDCEWGSPEHDDRRLFEFLILEGA